jgi:omega-6 fatty acid desaturase (delta-12 desaturase)
LQATAPSRKALLFAFESTALLKPLFILCLDLALFGGASALTLLAHSLLLKLCGSILITTAIMRLFLIGHEACHGSFFRHNTLNQVLGRLAFLPSLTAFSLWDVGHNVAHHGFNNLKGRDYVWTPFTKSEFDALPAHRRRLERIYRSGFGCGAYYLIELWWKKLYFATRRQIGSGRSQYKYDSALVTSGALLWVCGVLWIASATHQAAYFLVLLGIVVPFLTWNAIIGFVVFVHHTHPQIAWFDKRHDWQRKRGYIALTANVRLPFGIGGLMHNIMDHNAHHVNPRVPMFMLRAAQALLCERFASEFHSYRLNWRGYMDCARRCKLYDFTNHTWLDFRGEVTSRVLLEPEIATVA